MNKIKVEIIADSISEEGIRLITLHARYPRIIHSEVMTHRVFSRNARSSRAVPVKTMLEEIRNDPFVPWHWGKNQKGMQASEECNEPVIIGQNFIHDWPSVYEGKGVWEDDSATREEAWLIAARTAAGMAENFMNAGYHKQVANRLLEPFMYIDTLISSTSWANFYHLRDHEDAEPHFHDLASLIRTKVDESTPLLLKTGQWHLPYISPDETELELDIQKRLSVARCARISYRPFDGDASVEKELQRYDLLVGSEPLHASPTEHQATPDTLYKGEYGWNNPEFHGNFEGWIQYRKTLKGEYIQD